MLGEKNTHSVFIGYVLWIFGFTGSHRFYFGKKITGTIWFLTFGLFGIGWLVDIFLIPSMDREAEVKYREGEIDYNLAWLFLGFLGYLGIHRFYLRHYLVGVIYLLTVGLLGFGWLYDLWYLNELVDRENNNGKFE